MPHFPSAVTLIKAVITPGRIENVSNQSPCFYHYPSMVHSQCSSQSDAVKTKVRLRPSPMTPHFSGGKAKALTVVHTAQESLRPQRPLTSPALDH